MCDRHRGEIGMEDRFPEAAVRHWLDGKMLHQAHRYDNAMCHYAFSAECAIKAFRNQLLQAYTGKDGKRTHEVEPFWEALTEYYELMGILNPKLSLLIGIGAPPPRLFQDHPDRRYYNDINYTASDLAECEEFVTRLIQQVISAVIDGKLECVSEGGSL